MTREQIETAEPGWVAAEVEAEINAVDPALFEVPRSATVVAAADGWSTFVRSRAVCQPRRLSATACYS